MKNKLPPFLAGVLTTTILGSLTLTTLAASGQVSFNAAGIKFNGTQISAKGEGYALSSGAIVPASITYTDENGGGTTYLPARRISELLDIDIGYDSATGSVTIGADNTTDTDDTAAPSTDYSDWTAEEEAAYQEFKAMWDVQLYRYDENWDAQHYKATYMGTENYEKIVRQYPLIEDYGLRLTSEYFQPPHQIGIQFVFGNITVGTSNYLYNKTSTLWQTSSSFLTRDEYQQAEDSLQN